MKERTSPGFELATGVVCVALALGASFSFAVAVSSSPFKRYEASGARLVAGGTECLHSR